MTAGTAVVILAVILLIVLAFLIRKAARRVFLRRQRIVNLENELGAASARITHLEERATPPPAPVLNYDALQDLPEALLIKLAESLATLRPLIPYPGWHFGADWANPDLAFQMRQAIWQICRDRNAQVPITIGWYLDTRLQLHLGNDLSRQIYTAGCIDPNEFAFLGRYLQPGMTFVDAGANEGIYTVFAAKRVGAHGTVWAFEPSQRELDRLRANVDLNALPDRANVRLFPVALADRNGSAELTIAGFENAGHNTLGAFAYEGIATVEKQTVDLRRLDDLVAENPPARIDVIKMDVEGAELKLLTGAVSTLRQYRPVVLLEVSARSLGHQGSSPEKLLAFLRSNDYSLYLFDGAGLPSPAPAGTFADNMLALPQSLTLPSAVFEIWPDARL
jgi:FkbM family methyltransferase